MVQQRSVEREGHAGAHSKAWPSTAAEIVPRCNDVFVPLDSDFQGRAPVAQLVEHRAVMREVVSSTPAGRTNTQGLKITEENVLPL